MKKRLFLLITLIISLFIYSGRVEAAKELTCIYGESKMGDGYVAYIQNSDGSHELFINGKSEDLDDSSWKRKDDYKFRDEKELTECHDKWLVHSYTEEYWFSSGSDQTGYVDDETGKLYTYYHPFISSASHNSTSDDPSNGSGVNNSGNTGEGSGSNTGFTCIYGESKYGDNYVVYVQYSNGNHELFVGGKSSDLTDGSWRKSNAVVEYGTTNSDSSNPTKCYEWIWHKEANKYVFHNGLDKSSMYDDDTNGGDPMATNGHIYTYDHPYLEQKNGIHKPTNQNSSSPTSVDDNNWKEQYDGKCVYDQGWVVYFNRNELRFINNSSSRMQNINKYYDFTISEFLAYDSGYCPSRLYYDFDVASFVDDVNGGYYNDIHFKLHPGAAHMLELDEGTEYRDGYLDGINGKDIDINSCEDLIGEEVYDKINKYFGIIKIIIPILLIGFGVLDFAKAVFGNEDNMKKARQKFFMRIVAAVLFFLLPTLLKLILSLANSVWSFINPNTCIK